MKSLWMKGIASLFSSKTSFSCRCASLLWQGNVKFRQNFMKNYKMFREMRAPWLVRTSSLYFHKACALRHTSALLRYNAHSLRHRYECAQFTIYFITEIKQLLPRALLSSISTWEFLRRTRDVLPRTSLVFLKIPKCLYNSTMHSAGFLFL